MVTEKAVIMESSSCVARARCGYDALLFSSFQIFCEDIAFTQCIVIRLRIPEKREKLARGPKKLPRRVAAIENADIIGMLTNQSVTCRALSRGIILERPAIGCRRAHAPEIDMARRNILVG